MPSERTLPPGPRPGTKRLPHQLWAISWAVTRKARLDFASDFVRNPIASENVMFVAKPCA
jgi:hypothetical protein